MMKSPQQRIRYAKANDGIRLGWAEAGQGRPLLKTANWLTHLEYDWDSPVWRHWMQFFASHFRYIRYDERGCGMSDWNTANLSLERWLADIEDVVDAAKPQPPFALLGIGQGGATAIAYAVKHPERVSHLILYGAYARGRWRRDDHAEERRYRAVLDLCRFGTKADAFVCEMVTSELLPDRRPETTAWFKDVCVRIANSENAVRLLDAHGHLDVTDLLRQVTVPTLVIHSRDDQLVPVDEGRLLAAEIPDAEFMELDSGNHILLETEPAWSRFKSAVCAFTGITPPFGAKSPLFEALSTRELGILGVVTEGLNNAQIAERLFISEKTVRNHLSNIFAKLGVKTRAQAIVFARDHGFLASPSPAPAKAL